MTDADVYSPFGSLTNWAAGASVAELIAETVMAETVRWWCVGWRPSSGDYQRYTGIVGKSSHFPFAFA